MAQMAGVLFLPVSNFVVFLALISINLGIINLLPYTVLDGGHVVMHTYEWLMGKEMP